MADAVVSPWLGRDPKFYRPTILKAGLPAPGISGEVKRVRCPECGVKVTVTNGTPAACPECGKEVA